MNRVVVTQDLINSVVEGLNSSMDLRNIASESTIARIRRYSYHPSLKKHISYPVQKHRIYRNISHRKMGLSNQIDQKLSFHDLDKITSKFKYNDQIDSPIRNEMQFCNNLEKNWNSDNPQLKYSKQNNILKHFYNCRPPYYDTVLKKSTPYFNIDIEKPIDDFSSDIPTGFFLAYDEENINEILFMTSVNQPKNTFSQYKWLRKYLIHHFGGKRVLYIEKLINNVTSNSGLNMDSIHRKLYKIESIYFITFMHLHMLEKITLAFEK
ncbi:hypothetical protein A3Q56_07306 [Intoshia linei]|uniref:Uncharacterized protein n=1 Tax=Intoshia linei TaxID=1819745 RepID=A0A177ASL4_9BILA|nr:hypothetical protein A3Q56_07306 [Intoshia linei]